MFGYRKQAATQLVKFTKRRFGADAHHAANHHPPRMQFDEWKALNEKLKTPGLAAAEKNSIDARFTEARLGEFDLAFFEKRLSVQKMTNAEFEAYKHDVIHSRWARDHPLLTKHHEQCLMADRNNLPRPELYEMQLKPLPVYTKEQLGKGNYSQKIMNEWMYEAQNHPKAKYDALEGRNIGWLPIDYFFKQNGLFLLTAVINAFYAANLYRNMYLEKFTLLDMMNWETRVVLAQAKLERGW